VLIISVTASVATMGALDATTDGIALQAFKGQLQDPDLRTGSWTGTNPCNASAKWEGVKCTPCSVSASWESKDCTVAPAAPRVVSLDCYGFQLQGSVFAAALSNLAGPSPLAPGQFAPLSCFGRRLFPRLAPPNQVLETYISHAERWTQTLNPESQSLSP
jgi:hypothetical protein